MPGIQGRRYELFHLAALLFRTHGYRGATIKALAHACHMSPAAIYHYLPSKAAFATVIVAGPTTGLAADPTSVRATTIDLLRLHLVRVGVDAAHFDEAMTRG